MLRSYLLWRYFYGVPLLPFNATHFEQHIILIQVFQGMPQESVGRLLFIHGTSKIQNGKGGASRAFGMWLAFK